VVKKEHISRTFATYFTTSRGGRALARAELWHPFSSVRQARSSLSLCLMHHSANPSKMDEKFSELLSWELSRRDESKIPRCKCDRSSNDGPPNGFRLFAQPGFLRIYRLPFGKLLRKFVQFFGEIFIKHIFIIIAFYYILGLHGKIE